MLTYLKLLLTAFFWGGTFVAGRQIAHDIEPCSAAFLRFLIASFFLLIITRKVEGRLPALKKDQILPVLLLGLTGVFTYNIFFLKGLYYISAGRAALIIALNPIFISLLSAFFFKEKLTPVKCIGIAVSVTGAFVVITNGHLMDIVKTQSGWGEIFIFCCVASWVTYTLVGKNVMQALSPLVTVTYSSVVGTICLLPAALYKGLHHNLYHYSGMDWWGIFYLGFFGTVIGFCWYYEGIKKIGPTKAGLFINFVPISAIVLGYFILDESVSPALLTGAALVSTGVYFTNRSSMRRSREGWAFGVARVRKPLPAGSRPGKIQPSSRD